MFPPSYQLPIGSLAMLTDFCSQLRRARRLQKQGDTSSLSSELDTASPHNAGSITSLHTAGLANRFEFAV